ncbi:MAG TPA: hypothetical protein VLA19_11665, partial [Herpetosiphonaceae bacterium]|nr:hypothetical protein [Herpetosiphonaceae bacterium]
MAGSRVVRYVAEGEAMRHTFAPRSNFPGFLTGEQAVDDLLIVEGLKKYFPVKGGLLRRTIAQAKAVDGVSFTIKRGATLGLV